MAGIIKNISKNTAVRSAGGVSFGEVVYGPRGQCGPRIQADYQLVLLNEGSLKLCLDQIWMEVRPGDLVFCEPGHEELFLFAETTESRHQWCSVATRLVDQSLAALLSGSGGILPITSAMQALVDVGLSRSTASDEAAGFIVQLGLSMLHLYLAERAAHGADAAPEPIAVRKARTLIRENLTQPWTLKTLAARSGVSSNHLIKLFRDTVQVTPMEYVWRARLDYAFLLLSETGLSVSEIADRAGFQSAFHFSRRFKHRYGVSPRARRKATSLYSSENTPSRPTQRMPPST